MLNGIQISLLKHNAQVPFQVNISSEQFLTGTGAVLECVEILRAKPQKKMVCEAIFEKQKVIAKFFLSPDTAKSDFEKELSSYTLLTQAQINTPKQLTSGILNKSGFYVLYECVESINSLEKQIPLKPNKTSLAYINQIMQILAQMHNSNIQQFDLKIKHFSIQKDDQLIIVDCAKVIPLEIASSALSNETRITQIHKNLATLFAQLSINYDPYRESFLKSYQLATIISKKLSLHSICQDMKQIRQADLQKYQRKALIGHSEFIYEKDEHKTLIYDKQYADKKWLNFYQQINSIFDASSHLKENHSANILLAQCGGKEVIIKRYTKLKLSKSRKSSQAWNSWQNAHQLIALGIKAPKPIAIIEQGIGWLKNYSFYLSEYDTSENALSHYSMKTELSKEHLEEFKQLFTAMISSNISHSDLRADNILLTNDGLSLIDVDTIKFYSSSTIKSHRFKKIFDKDLQSFMKNWPLNSTMYQQFKQLLAELPDKAPC